MSTQICIVPKDWNKFQHYKTRLAPWIKVPRSHLEDRVMASLGVEARLVAYQLLLLASEHPKGLIDLPLEVVCHRISMSSEQFLEGLISLMEHGYFASGLASK